LRETSEPIRTPATAQDAKTQRDEPKRGPTERDPITTLPYPVPFASLLLCVGNWFENQTTQSSAQRRLAALVSAAQEDYPTFKPPHRPPLASRL
jgi:hypothetical protein